MRWVLIWENKHELNEWEIYLHRSGYNDGPCAVILGCECTSGSDGGMFQPVFPGAWGTPIAGGGTLYPIGAVPMPASTLGVSPFTSPGVLSPAGTITGW
jgi:hypothetical protein